MAADVSALTPPEGVELVEAEVIAAGVSYFTSSHILDANGNPQKDQQGNPQVATIRNEARLGDKITISQHEYDRLADLGAVQEPGSAPLPNSPDAPIRPTPFTVPLTDQPRWEGPVMGDPRPAGPDTPENELAGRPGVLTAEQAAELERRAAEGVGGGEGQDDAAFFQWEDDTTSDDVRAFVDANSLNVDATLALAGGTDNVPDQHRAELVLEAELASDKPRAGVVSPLEKLVEGSEGQ